MRTTTRPVIIEVEIDLDSKKSGDGLDDFVEKLEAAAQAEREFNQAVEEAELDAFGDELDGVADGVFDAGQQAEKSSISFGKLAAAAGAIAGVAIAGATASDRVTELERAGARAAVSQGMTNRQMYDYNNSLDTASDSIDEIIPLTNYLARAGFEMNDETKETVNTFLDLADATGLSADALASDLIPTLNALDEPLSKIPDYANAIAYAQQNTLFDVQNWSFMMRVYGDDLKDAGVAAEDTIAIMAKMEEAGLPLRNQRQLINKILSEESDRKKELVKDEETLIELKQKLIDEQTEYNKKMLDGSTTTGDYIEDMQSAGRDVSRMRDLTLAYNRKMKDESAARANELLEQQARVDAARAKVDEKQKEIETGKSASSIDVLASLEKEIPGITEYVKNYKSKTTDYLPKAAEQAGIATAGETQKWELDEATRLVGSNIDTNLAKALFYVGEVSAGISTISGVLSIIEAYSAITATATAGTAATQGISIASMKGVLAAGGLTAAGAVAGGLALGAVGVGVMEATGTTTLYDDITGGKNAGKGIIEKAGGGFADWITGDSESAYIQEYYRTHNGAVPPGYTRDPKTGNLTKLPSYADGGVVPGAGPKDVTVHGGEEIIPARDRGSGGFSLHIGNVNLSKDYPLESLYKDAMKLQRDRKQMGMRT